MVIISFILFIFALTVILGFLSHGTFVFLTYEYGQNFGTFNTLSNSEVKCFKTQLTQNIIHILKGQSHRFIMQSRGLKQHFSHVYLLL